MGFSLCDDHKNLNEQDFWLYILVLFETKELVRTRQRQAVGNFEHNSILTSDGGSGLFLNRFDTTVEYGREQVHLWYVDCW